MKWSFLIPALFLCAAAQARGGESSAWTGEMEAGRVYSAAVTYQNEMWWPEGLAIPSHHGVHVGWENLAAFPVIPAKPRAGQSMKWTWKVLSKEVRKVPNRYQWRTTFSCRILRVEAEKAN